MKSQISSGGWKITEIDKALKSLKWYVVNTGGLKFTNFMMNKNSFQAIFAIYH